MRIRRKSTSTSRLRKRLRFLEPSTRLEIAEAMDYAGRTIADEITANAPRDKGDLAEAATYKVSNDKLGVSVGYSQKQAGFKRAWKKGGFTALWQEFGTRHHAATPFIRPAYHAKLAQILDRIDAAVRTAINKAGQA